MDDHKKEIAVTMLADGLLTDPDIRAQIISEIQRDKMLAFNAGIQEVLSGYFKEKIIKKSIPADLQNKILGILAGKGDKND